MSAQTIVVIDDSPTLLKLVQLVLGEMSLKVATAATGSTGWELIMAEPPSLVLLDDVLEDDSVEDLCRRIATQCRPTPPVVLLRSGRGPQDPLKFAAVVDSIAKPFSPDALKALVSHILGVQIPAAISAPRRRLTLTPPPDFAPTAAASDHKPAITGDLSVFGASELLGLLSEGHHTGEASFTQNRSAVRIRFKQGRIAMARADGVQDEFLLGRFLVESQRITASALEEAMKGSGIGQPHLRLGQRLMRKGLITQADLEHALRLHSSALVFELLRWEAGQFSFVLASPQTTQEDDVELGLVVDQVLMEGLRRIDEWRLIERDIHNFDEVFVREEDRMAAMGPGKLLHEEIAVAELLNGRNSIRDVVFQSHMGSFEVCRVIYRLLKSKLIRPRVLPVPSV